MASMSILMLPGTVSATGGLCVSGDSGSATGSTPAAIGNTLGTTAAAVNANAPPLLVKFV